MILITGGRGTVAGHLARSFTSWAYDHHTDFQP
jgi:nucleoside-diphosphate-sugar epimerase